MRIRGREVLLPTTMVGNYPNPGWYGDQPWAVFPDAAGAAAARLRPDHPEAVDPDGLPRGPAKNCRGLRQKGHVEND